MRKVLDSDWGRLFRNWEDLAPTQDGFDAVGDVAAEIRRTGFNAFKRSLGILVSCIREAPEFLTLRKRQIQQK